MGRDLSPRGAFVVLVGPDGVGKTTVARALTAAYAVVGYLATVRPTYSRRSPSTRGLRYYRAWLYRLQP
jgi:thymidylate kinase